jgi:hypothetical protein
VILLAAAAALTPLPSSAVERYYADSFYPALQPRLTSFSNSFDISIFEVIVGIASLQVMLYLLGAIRGMVRQRSLGPVVRNALATAALAAVMFLWFEVAWGLNYAREPLETVLAYDRSRVTAQAVRALAERTVTEVNQSHAGGHATGFAADGVPQALLAGLHDVERRLGKTSPTVVTRPKRPFAAAFFRASGTDGMHAPFVLETLLNPDLTPPERPAVLAHEWAHLAGFAPEDDASFVGLLAALRADAGSRYSAWLALFHDAVAQLPPGQQRELVGRLAPGPQADRRAIAQRLAGRVEAVAEVSWQTYDRYLKAQGVAEGVQSYSRVVNLFIGSGALDWPR